MTIINHEFRLKLQIIIQLCISNSNDKSDNKSVIH